MPAPSPRRRLTAFAVALAVLVATPLAVVGAEEFTDVPADNPHRNDIAWLADAAVTLGCNPPANTNYCPDQPVRRDQMASFLRRLAENQVVDAATLAGRDPSEYRSIAVADLDTTLGGTLVDTLTEINSVTIDAPTPGVLLISGSALLQSSEVGNNSFGLFPTVNGEPIGATGVGAFVLLDNAAAEHLSYSVAVEVPAGVHEVIQSVSALSNLGAPESGEVFYNLNYLTVTWHPEGSVTLSPAGGGGSLLGD